MASLLCPALSVASLRLAQALARVGLATSFSTTGRALLSFMAMLLGMDRFFGSLT